MQNPFLDTIIWIFDFPKEKHDPKNLMQKYTSIDLWQNVLKISLAKKTPVSCLQSANVRHPPYPPTPQILELNSSKLQRRRYEYFLEPHEKVYSG